MTDRHQLTALAALHSLRQAYAWLADVADAELVPAQQASTAPRRLTARAAAGHDQLLRLEKLERITADRQGIKQIGATPAPVRLGLVDAATVAQAAVTDSAWIVSSAVRLRPLLVFGPAWVAVYGGLWQAQGAQLRVALPWTPPAVAREVGGLLDQADLHVRGLLGVGKTWLRLPYQVCRTCKRRSIEAEVSSESEADWVLRCEHGCVTSTVEAYGRVHGRLADLLALIRSVRRQGQKRGRPVAA